MKLLRVIILLICCLLASDLFSQELNSKFELKTASYSYKDYKGAPQIRSITQDKFGVMYFANQFGIAVYNGDNWSFIDFFGYSVRSLACDSSGVIYVGGIDFGCLETQKNGFREFRSFKSLIPDTLNFSLIENISVIKSGLVFFQSKKFLFIYNGATISIIENDGELNFNNCFVVNDEFYVFIKNKGIKKYENGKLIDYFKNDIFNNSLVHGFFKFLDKDVIVSENDGAFVKEGEELISIFKNNHSGYYNSINISNSYLSIGTDRDGVFLINKDFEVEYNLNSKNGLLDGVINCQFSDREGNLWLGTNSGINKVLINSPVSIYSLTKNKATTIEAIKHFNGATYFASQNGVFYSENNSFKNGLKEIKGIKTDCYGFLDFNIGGDTLLLIATVDAIYSYSSTGVAKKIANCSPWHMEKDFADSTRVIVCNYDGLSSIKWNGNRFIDEGFVKGFNKNIYRCKYDSLGSLFIGAIGEGLYKTEGSVFYDSTTAIENISKEIDVIEDGHAYVSVINNNIYVGTNHGLYKRTNSGFEKTNEFGSEKHITYGIHRIKQTPDGKVWMVMYNPKIVSEYEIGYSEKINGKYVWHSENFKNYTDELVHSICNLDAKITWLGGIEHVFRFDNSNIVKNNKTFHTLFNSVKWADSVLYHGATTNFNYIDNNLEINKIPTSLEYSNKRMEFNYSATSFLDEKRTLFSYMLEGSDNTWSDWSKETKAQFTNLPDGNYVFKVRSKNYLNNLGIETSFSFTILPPWYKTIWAYFLYVIAAILLLVFGIRVGTNRIKRQKDLLEKVVKQRTQEVTDQKNEIEGQREELLELYNDVTDSIKYAKRLQDSILPSDNFIKELFPDSFVYYLPKDIVSGDFYWAEKIGDSHLLAAVDCTGHGVPGAFMSLVGANGLNASVREHQLNAPNLILEDLNRFAFSSLNKGDEGQSVRDGMDMSLISFSPKTKKITFSGANNPLYVVSNGEIKIIKGDKHAIGSFKPGAKRYTQHSVEVKTNDMVYLFSDGYPDQFGGEKGKKLMYKQFRNILVEISTLSIEKQKLELDHRLQQWKLNQEQVDDILVIGFRVN